MATSANIGRWKFRYGDGASPEAFTDVVEVFNISGAGRTNDLEQVTNFDSPVGQHEYIAGLSDGDEVSVEANFVPSAASQEALHAQVAAGTNLNYQVAYVGVSPEVAMTFVGSPIHASLVPSATGRNVNQFRVKISSVTTNGFSS